MKKLFRLFLLCLLCFGAVSCEKVEYRSFIRNNSGQDVKISFSMFDKDYNYSLHQGEELEIPDGDRWTMVNNAQSVGNVVFTFADGQTYSHTCQVDSVSGAEVFIPAKGNILDSDDENGGWILSKMKGNNFRYDFTVKK